MWYRVFGGRREMPEPERILAFLETQQASLSGEFTLDESGWYRADFFIEGTSLQLERYLADETGASLG